MTEDEQILEEKNTLLALGSKSEKQIEKERLQEAGLVAPDNLSPDKPSRFKPAYGGKKGFSTVDLSDPDNEQQMFKEHREWFMTGKDEDASFTTRDSLRDKWYRKYKGMSHEEFTAETPEKYQKGLLYGSSNPLKILGNTIDGLRTPGLGVTDFVMDAVGLLPGGERVDDIYDADTRLDSPGHQKMREIFSILIPGIMTGGKVNSYTATKFPQAARWSLPWWKRLGANAAINLPVDTAIVGISDTSEQDTITTTLAKQIPDIFGSEGHLPLPEILKTRDSDSPAVRRYRTMLENLPIPILGNVVGALFDVPQGRKVLDWFEPLDESATRYKQVNIAFGGDTDKLMRLSDINDELVEYSKGTRKLDPKLETRLINEKLNLENELANISDFDDVMRRSDVIENTERSARAARKLDNIEQLELDLGIDPDISPAAFDEGAKGGTIPPAGNVARNMADTAAIRQGVSKGDPAPVITDSMIKKGLMIGPESRDVVRGVAEAARDAGRFNAVVDGFRFTAKEMNAAAWGIYNDIITAGSVPEIKEFFLTNMDVKNLLGNMMRVEYVSEDAARAAGFALRDLTNQFLGVEIGESSARVMDSLGREAATLADATIQFAGLADPNKMMDLILDKMLFLLDELAINKYIAGWSLRNKNFFDQMLPENMEAGIKTLLDEFKGAQNSIALKNKKFVKELKQLKKTNPEVVKPLMDAFAHTNGDVDSQAKLMKWAAQQITPMGYFKSHNPKEMNLFARGLWGVRYNNVLSGLAPLNAAVGNGGALTLKPITSLLGHGFYGYGDGFEGFKRTIFYNGAIKETNRRAIKDAYEMMKKAHKDPEMMVKTYRKDFVFKVDKTWELMEDMRPIYEKQGNYARLYQLDLVIAMKQLGAHPALRYGMTGMVFPDVFASTHMAHNMSRVRAYDDVFSDKGFADFAEILKAEKKHYDNMFDADGLIKDKAVRAMAGEIQLNMDDGMSRWMNEATTAYPILKEVLMFPRTLSNATKLAASYTPISLLPGISKYSKTIYAKTDDDIAEALLEHGLIMAKTPNARVVWENLRAEYTGRLIFSSLLVTSLFNHAMAGNITGPGHYNQAERSKQLKNGFKPHMILMPVPFGGDKNDFWIDYSGIPGVKEVLDILASMAQYANDIDEAFLESIESKLMWVLSASFARDTPLQGFEPLVNFINGDMSAFYQQTRQSLKTLIPQIGTFQVVETIISDALKDIQTKELLPYLMSKIPFLSGFVPEQIDIYTGTPIGYTENNWLRAFNAASPVKVAGRDEDWRVFLGEIGFDGLTLLKKDSTGTYEYNPTEREEIYGYIGEQQIYKQIIRIMNTKRYQEEIEMVKAHRRSNKTSDLITIDVDSLPVMQDLRSVITNAQKIAEIKFLRNNPKVKDVIVKQQAVDDLMRKGKVDEAVDIKNKTTRKLLNMRK